MNRYSTEAWKSLESAQNSEQYSMIDIITITGFMNDSQLIEHINRYSSKQWISLNDPA